MSRIGQIPIHFLNCKLSQFSTKNIYFETMRSITNSVVVATVGLLALACTSATVAAQDIPHSETIKQILAENIVSSPLSYFSSLPNISFDYNIVGRFDGESVEPTLKIRMRFVHENGKFVIEEIERNSPSIKFVNPEKYTFDGSKYYYLNKDGELKISSRPISDNRFAIFSLPFWAPYWWVVPNSYCNSLAELSQNDHWHKALETAALAPTNAKSGLTIKLDPSDGISYFVTFEKNIPFPLKFILQGQGLVATTTVNHYQTVPTTGSPFLLPTSISNVGADPNGKPMNTGWQIDVDVESIRLNPSGVFTIPLEAAKRVYDVDIDEYIKK